MSCDSVTVCCHTQPVGQNVLFCCLPAFYLNLITKHQQRRITWGPPTIQHFLPRRDLSKKLTQFIGSGLLSFLCSPVLACVCNKISSWHSSSRYLLSSRSWTWDYKYNSVLVTVQFSTPTLKPHSSLVTSSWSFTAALTLPGPLTGWWLQLSLSLSLGQVLLQIFTQQTDV